MRYSSLLLGAVLTALSFTSAAPTGQDIKSIEQRDVIDNSQLAGGLVQTAINEIDDIVLDDDDNGTPQKATYKYSATDSLSPSSKGKKFEEGFKNKLTSESVFDFVEHDYQSSEQPKSPK